MCFIWHFHHHSFPSCFKLNIWRLCDLCRLVFGFFNFKCCYVKDHYLVQSEVMWCGQQEVGAPGGTLVLFSRSREFAGLSVNKSKAVSYFLLQTQECNLHWGWSRTCPSHFYYFRLIFLPKSPWTLSSYCLAAIGQTRGDYSCLQLLPCSKRNKLVLRVLCPWFRLSGYM